MRLLRKVFRLLPHERELYVRAFLLVVGIRLILWLLPFSVCRRLLVGGRPPFGFAASDPQLSPAAIAAAVNRVARLVPGATCLPRALAVQALLRRSGHAAHLRIGIARADAAGIEAHAWIEYGDSIVIGGEDLARYSQLPALSPAQGP